MNEDPGIPFLTRAVGDVQHLLRGGGADADVAPRGDRQYTHAAAPVSVPYAECAVIFRTEMEVVRGRRGLAPLDIPITTGARGRDPNAGIVTRYDIQLLSGTGRADADVADCERTKRKEFSARKSIAEKRQPWPARPA